MLPVRNPTRRSVLQQAGGVVAASFHILRAAVRNTDIRVEDVSIAYEDYKYRTPIKFGGHVLDRATLLNVNCSVRTGDGRIAKGFGSMPLGNIWSFPSKVLSYEATLGAMQALAAQLAKITAHYKDFGHPIDISWALDPMYRKAAADVSERLSLAEPIPPLCALVTASAFDAAIHDAFGKAHGLNCYHTYGPEFMKYDLGHYLGPEYKGEFPSRYVSQEPKRRMPVYHLVSAIDPIEESDITKRINDGLPETLPEWIRYNGLTHFKIKLNGDDRKWDVERVLHVDRVTTQTQRQRGAKEWVYSLDFNEKCPNVQYLLDFLHEVKEKTAEGYERIQYVEQPTARDLKAHPENMMQEAAKLRPVVIDESLTDVEALLLSQKMGYTGAALKACKGQSHMMLIASVAEKHKLFLCVQDLTCPGASLIQSAALAAHVPGVAAIEANSRQFMPEANRAWESRFPGIFRITDGTMDTSELNKVGLGAVEG
ncbi:MAG TPA: enolase C-terminal domain-like protein [Bryobacteraceae bacterium]|nr:enolase C-terminal domain-like protein [Bryobacteraceae bacterium]